MHRHWPKTDASADDRDRYRAVLAMIAAEAEGLEVVRERHPAIRGEIIKQAEAVATPAAGRP